jgi:23S rRNA (cytidine1920-2'-O)/16S rRNA (cytidine1409-2'-O)-methyltransferase
VQRGLCESEADARAIIDQGRILVGGSVATNARRQVQSGDAIVVQKDKEPYVGRGGEKLARALRSFSIDVVGRSAVDAGSATGGFTDCLLQAGAARVLAVDVGYGQLHERLRADPRVVNLERSNIRSITRARAIELCSPEPPPSIITADLSFSSVTIYIGGFVDLLAGHGDLVLLCKPQFEVSRALASKRKGVIIDDQERRTAIDRVAKALRDHRVGLREVVCSPILGPAGNAEFLLHGALDDESDAVDIEEQIDRSIEDAGAL